MATGSDEALAALATQIPDFAADLRVNLGAVMASPHLTAQQGWGTALASAIAARNPHLVDAVTRATASHLSQAALQAVWTAASLAGMSNVYYHFTELVRKDEYRHMPARLSMRAIVASGVERVDFELWSLAVSAINGCGACILAHEKHLSERGATREAVQDAVRIAAVMHGIAIALESRREPVTDWCID